jgi:hypothetical protein
MPQIWFRPFMAATMVKDSHAVKPFGFSPPARGNKNSRQHKDMPETRAAALPSGESATQIRLTRSSGYGG